jgi:sulfur transfer complex TusBCD TusB component (DsrH family)
LSDSNHNESAAPAPTCVHLLLRAEGSVLQDCLASCSSGDCLVLMDAAVTLVAGPSPKSAFRVEFCCLEADVHAHGLRGLVSGSPWKQITDLELVERVVRHRHCLSWK